MCNLAGNSSSWGSNAHGSPLITMGPCARQVGTCSILIFLPIHTNFIGIDDASHRHSLTFTMVNSLKCCLHPRDHSTSLFHSHRFFVGRYIAYHLTIKSADTPCKDQFKSGAQPLSSCPLPIRVLGFTGRWESSETSRYGLNTPIEKVPRLQCTELLRLGTIRTSSSARVAGQDPSPFRGGLHYCTKSPSTATSIRPCSHGNLVRPGME